MGIYHAFSTYVRGDRHSRDQWVLGHSVPRSRFYFPAVGASGTCYVMGSISFYGTAATTIVANSFLNNVASNVLTGTSTTVNTTTSNLIDLKMFFNGTATNCTATCNAGFAEIIG